MSNPEKLNQEIEVLAGVLESIKQDKLSLSELMDAFANAVAAFGAFNEKVECSKLHVKKIETREDGTYIELPFDWEKQGNS
jgi:hypothetical protein